MKGISTVIATILLLMITIALVGVAWTLMMGYLGPRISVILDIVTGPGGSSCAPATNAITVVVRNDGKDPITADFIKIGGIKADGTDIAETSCGPSTAAVFGGNLYTCPNTVTGADGNNKIRVRGGGSIDEDWVYCA